MANSKQIIIKNTLISIMVAAALALCGAYIGEHVFGLKPCILCLYQRIPYFMVIAIALIGYFFKQNNLSRTIIYFSSLVFLLGALLALFHVGVERGWINEPSTCTTNIEEVYGSISALKTAVYSSAGNMPSCKEVQFVFLGMSMAGWNFIYSLILAIYCFFTGKKLGDLF